MARGALSRQHPQASGDLGQHLAVALGTPGRARVGGVALDPAPQLQKLRRVVPVARDGLPEGEAAQVLKRVVELVEAGIAGLPPGVAAGEEIGGEGREPQQVVASVHHHVDGEVVARQHQEVGPAAVA